MEDKKIYCPYKSCQFSDRGVCALDEYSDEYECVLRKDLWRDSDERDKGE